MPPFVIYARKSTESADRQVASIESQIKEMRLTALHRGFDVIDVLEESRSAKRPGRPVFDAMMRRVNRGEIRGILAWKMDRLARNHLDHGALLQALADHALEQIVTSDRTYTQDGTDRFIGNVDLGIATKYSDDLSHNVRRGIRSRLERGWCNHQPRLGYLIDPISKDIIADPERYDKVRRLLRLALTRSMSMARLLQIATEEIHLVTRRGRPLSRSTLYAMLGDPFYAGVNQLRDGRRYPGAHPPMIAMDDYRELQEVLGRTGRARPKRHSFAFTGIMKCGHCGGAITAEEHIKPDGRRYVYYRCSRQRAGIVCREPAVSEKELLRQLCHRLRFLRIPEPVHAWLCKQADKEGVTEQAREDQIRRTVNQAMAGLDREESNLIDMRAKEVIPETVFAAKQRHLRERRESLKAQAAQLARPESLAKPLAKFFTFANQASELLRTGTAVQQRMIVETIGLNYTLKARKVAYQLEQPLQIISDAGGFSNWSGVLDDVRTWILESSRVIRIPDLPLLFRDDSPSCW